jgi:flagellar biosynthesis chaperone FliJ
MSSSQPLKTLLIVRRGAEEAAAQVLARATAHRAAAEETHLRLAAQTQAARDDLRQRRASGASNGPEGAAQAAERQQFWARLSEAVARHSARALAYRTGELDQAERKVAHALTAYSVAREARQVVETLLGKAEAGERQQAARREEVALDEQSQAVRPRPAR